MRDMRQEGVCHQKYDCRVLIRHLFTLIRSLSPFITDVLWPVLSIIAFLFFKISPDRFFNDLSPFVLHLSQFFLHLSPFAFPQLHVFTKVNHAPGWACPLNFLIYLLEFCNLSPDFEFPSSPVAPVTVVPHCCTSLFCNIITQTSTFNITTQKQTEQCNWAISDI